MESALIQLQANSYLEMRSLANTGYLIHNLMDKSFSDTLELLYVDRRRKQLRVFADGVTPVRTYSVVHFNLETSGYTETILAHVVEGLNSGYLGVAVDGT